MEEVLQSGLLQGKIPKKKGMWMVYYLELTNSQFRIFLDVDRRKHLYNLKISSRDKVSEEPPKKTQEYKFHLATSIGRHTFKCNTSEQRREWVLKIQKIITRAQLGQIADLPTNVTSTPFDPAAVGQSPNTPKHVEVPKPPTPILIPVPSVPPIAPTAPVATVLPLSIRSQHQPTIPVTATVTGVLTTPTMVGWTRGPRMGPPMVPPKNQSPHKESASPPKNTAASTTAAITVPHNGISHTSSTPTAPPSPPKRAPRPPPLEIPTSRAGPIDAPTSSATEVHRRSPITPKRRAPPIPDQKSPPKPNPQLQSSLREAIGKQQISGLDSKQMDHQKPNAIALQAVLQQRPRARVDASVSLPEHTGNHRDRLVNGTRAGYSANGCARHPVSDGFHHQLSEKLLLASSKESAQSSVRALPTVAHPRPDAVRRTPKTTIGNGTNESRPWASDSGNSYTTTPSLLPNPRRLQSDAPPHTNGVASGAHPQVRTTVGSESRPLASDSGNSYIATHNLPSNLRRHQRDGPPHTNGVAGGAHPQVRTTGQSNSMPNTSVAGFPSGYSALRDCVWFWGIMSREDCERKLATEGVMGNIAVRLRHGMFVISCRQADGFHHHRVVQDGQVFRFERSTKQLECHSLVELLDVFIERNSKDKSLSLFGSGGHSFHDDPLDQDYEIVFISDAKQPRVPTPKASGNSHYPSPSTHRRGWTKPLPPIPSDSAEMITQENPHYKPIRFPPHVQHSTNPRNRTK